MFTTRRFLFQTYTTLSRNTLFQHGLKKYTTSASQNEIILEKLSGNDTGIAVISLNRGKVRNALGKDLMQNFRKYLHELNFDKECRTVIIKSNVEGIFCAGADLKERAEMSVTEVAHFVHSLRAAFTEIETLPMPTIAVLDGVAVGGGLELALSCDIRVAGSKAVMGLPETGLAIIPGAGGTQRLPRLIGAAKAKELIFTGENVSAEKALELGIVQHVTESGKAYEKALEIARKILPKGPVAIRAAKSAIDKGLAVDPSTGLFIEQACYAQVIPTKDRLEGLLAFKEKRKPVYKGE